MTYAASMKPFGKLALIAPPKRSVFTRSVIIKDKTKVCVSSRVRERVISARDRVASSDECERARRRGRHYRHHPTKPMSEIARRRSVLQSSQDNGRTGIPMALPPSAMKKSTSQNKRLSVAGPAARGVFYPPAALAVPSTNPRQSLYRSQNMNPLLASASKHSRTPLQSYAFFPTIPLRYSVPLREVN
jgi:hypothetical protein